MPPHKSIVLIDDHDLFREGLKAILRRDATLAVVGEAKNADDGMQAVLEAKPDIVLLDISLPGRSGLELTREIRMKVPSALVVIVSMFARADLVKESVEAGAVGYVTKGSTPETLLQCIRSVLEGRLYLDGVVSQGLLTALDGKGPRIRKVVNEEYGSLSPREQEVLRMIAEGIPTRDIAERLFISVKTVENHRVNILRKLELKTTVDLVKYAARIGLIDIENWKA